METARALLGPFDERDLQYVDAYVGRNLGVFIPSVGHCGLAIRPGHTHPAFSLVLFPDAELDFLFGGAYPPGPGEYLAAALSPQVPHEEPGGEEFVSYMAVMVGGRLCEQLSGEMPIPQCDAWRPFFVPRSAMALLGAFMAESQSRGSDILLDSLETAVAATLMRCLAGADREGPVGVPSFSPGIQAAADHIRQHYGRKLTVDGLAGLAAMSSGTFSRTFRRETGMSPAQFLIDIRLQKARKLLADSALPVTETALRCGFHSASHLAGCFKRRYGITPTAFRERRNLQKKG